MGVAWEGGRAVVWLSRAAEVKRQKSGTNINITYEKIDFLLSIISNYTAKYMEIQ
jgi:hypothetical protein